MKRKNKDREIYVENEGGEETRPKKKLPGWVILPILAVLVLVFIGLSKLSGGGAKTRELDVTSVAKEDIRQVYNTSGTVTSAKTKIFYSPVNAKIKSFKPEVGTAVHKGQKLVTFDVTNLERDNRQSELNALSAKYANQDAAEQSSRAAKAESEAKKKAQSSIKSLQSQISKKEKEVKKLEKTVKNSASAAADAAKKTAELEKKMQKNLDSQTSVKAEKENAERQLANLNPSDADYEKKSQELMETAEKATNTLSSLEQDYRKLEQQLQGVGSVDASAASTQLAAAKQELEGLKASLTELKNSTSSSSTAGLTSGQKKNMEVSENLAELSEKSTKELLEEGKKGIKAEFDGIISDVKAAEGSEAVQGGELFTLVSNEDVYVELEVSVNDFDSLRENGKAEVTIGDKTYEGVLSSINKIALPNEKGNPVIKARVEIQNPDEDIYVGVNAKVSLETASKNQALCLPIEVINTSTDGDFVYVIRNGEVKKQNVELGIVSDSLAEVTSGLEEGDEVISDTGSDITEGMKASAKKE